MALFGIFSLLQIWFIPGYLLLSISRSMRGVDRFFLAFPVSAVINFFIVYFLTALGIYSRLSVFLIFFIEISLFAYFYLSDKSKRESIKFELAFSDADERNFSTFVFALLFFICAYQSLGQIGTVFTQGDAVISWNSWGVRWFYGEIPGGLAWYPQLLPTLYSLTYKFIGNSQVELFAKISVSAYPVVVLGMFVRFTNFLPKFKYVLIWSSVILFLLIRRLWGVENTINGYAEFPLVFFAVSIIYVFLLRQHDEFFGDFSGALIFTILVVVTTVGAGLTKQSGVFLGFLVPFFWVLWFEAKETSRVKFFHVVAMGISIGILLLFWYAYQFYRINMGLDQSNLKLLSTIVKMPWYESIGYGFRTITSKLTWLWVLFFIFSFFNLPVRYISFCIVLPFFLLWAAFVPYDYRNLAVIFPFLAISLVCGFVKFFDFIAKYISVRSIFLVKRSALPGLIVVLGVALVDSKVDRDLSMISDNAKIYIGNVDVNRRLLAYFEFNPDVEYIASPYQELSKIPGLMHRYKSFSCGYDFGQSDVPVDVILSELNGIHADSLLLMPWCNSKFLEYVSSHTNEYKLIFKIDDAVFYKKIF